MSWAEIKHALNSKLGESDMKALDELIEELATTLANVNNAVATVDNVVDTINTNVNAVKTNTAASTTAAIGGTLSQKLEYIIDTLLGTVNATGGSTTAGSIMAKLNALLTSWTSTRAGYVDNIRSYTITNNTANKTGILSQKLAYVISLLENSSYGLNKLKNYLEDSSVFYKGTINNGTALASKVYANSAEISAGTTIIEVNDVIFDNVSDSYLANVRILFAFMGGGGKVTMMVDDWSIDLTTSANNQSSALNYSVIVPTGVKIKSIKVVAKDKITCFSNNSSTPQATLSPNNANAFFV